MADKGLYTKRLDGRKADELRPVRAEIGVIPNADGSALFAHGDTLAIAAVYGPKPLHPQHLQKPDRGIIRANYNMLPFSVTERARPGPSRRSKEISMVTANALSAVVNLKKFPGTVIDVEILIFQANASTRCAGINAAAMALAHAGLPMKQMLTAIAVGKADKTLLVDVDKAEEDFHDGEGATDIPLAVTSRTKEIALLQLDGKISPSELSEAIEMGKKACDDILKVQMDALKNVTEIKNG